VMLVTLSKSAVHPRAPDCSTRPSRELYSLVSEVSRCNRLIAVEVLYVSRPDAIEDKLLWWLRLDTSARVTI
jgi:hypothetical protein